MPIQPIDGFVPANGLQLHYRRWLPPKTASPGDAQPRGSHILLLHGLASASRIWDFVAPPLAEHGYIVTALDQRGHGESDKPDAGYDFATIVADDAAAMQALEIDRAVVVGHSWGAAVALQLAATHPAKVAALVLVDGATGQLSLRPGWTREQAMQDLAPPRFAGTPRDTFLSYFRSGPLGKQWSPELEDAILHIVQLREDNTVAPRLAFENHLQIISAMWDQPTFDLYRQVHCPITLVIAEQQPASEREAAYFRMKHEGVARIQSLHPHARVVWLPDTIHDIPLQRPILLVEEILRTAQQA